MSNVAHCLFLLHERRGGMTVDELARAGVTGPTLHYLHCRRKLVESCRIGGLRGYRLKKGTGASVGPSRARESGNQGPDRAPVPVSPKKGCES